MNVLIATLILADSWWDHSTLIFWGAMALMCIISEVGYYAVRWRKAELDAELKQEMIARGMSAEEIKTVLETRPKK